MGQAMKTYIFILVLLCYVLSKPARPQTTPSPSSQPGLKEKSKRGRNAQTQVNRSANLDLARTYERLKKWPDAEKYYQEAAKESDPTVWREGLHGIERVQAAAVNDSQELAGGQYYKTADVPDEAEDQYVAALKSNSEVVRKMAQQALIELESALWMQRKFDLVLQWVKYVTVVLGAISVVLLVIGSVRIRQSIEVAGFSEVGEKVQGKMPFWLSYVRSRIRFLTAIPASQISPLIASPPMLYLALPSFRDELPEPDKEVDIGGTKIPLASFIGLYVKPKVKIVGGWTAPAGTANGTAFAAIYRRSAFRGDRPSGFVTRPIRVGTPDEDLEAFAYDVYVKAVESHAL
jgi:hypothetical protein